MRPQLNIKPASSAPHCEAPKPETTSSKMEKVNVVENQSKPAAQSQQSESDKRMGLAANSDDPNKYVDTCALYCLVILLLATLI